MSDTADTLLQLQSATKTEWEEISPAYMRFRLDTSPFNQFCVVAGDNEFYIPKEGGSSYNASDIATLLINANNLHPIDDSPWIEIELDKLPRLCFSTRVTKDLIAVGTLGLLGTLRMNQISSSNDKTFVLNGQDFSVYEARNTIGDIISSLQVSINPDMQLKMESSITANNFEISLEVDPPNFSATLTPTNKWQTAIYHNWEIETTLGCQIEGKYYPSNTENQSASTILHNIPVGIVQVPGIPPIKMDQESLKRTIATKAGLAIFFVLHQKGDVYLKVVVY